MRVPTPKDQRSVGEAFTPIDREIDSQAHLALQRPVHRDAELCFQCAPTGHERLGRRFVVIHQIQSQKCVLMAGNVPGLGSRWNGCERSRKEILDLGRTAQQDLIDGEMAHRLPLLAERIKGAARAGRSRGSDFTKTCAHAAPRDLASWMVGLECADPAERA